MTNARIQIDPGIMFGKPVIAGTRITVEQILRKIAAGISTESILADHPGLRDEDIRSAVEFAADYIAREEVVYVAEPRK